MKRLEIISIFLLAFFVVATGFAEEKENLPTVPSEIMKKEYLCEISRHLYRWYVDEIDIEKLRGTKKFPLWIRRLNLKLDSGDESILGEILFPLLSVSVRVKKADYRIDELGAVVKGDTFKIINVQRIQAPPEMPPGYILAELDCNEIREYLYQTRNQPDYPSLGLIERMRKSVIKELSKEPEYEKQTPVVKEHIIHVAPLSPIANEFWVFWEDGKMLIHFSSDIDLNNPAVWDLETLTVKTFDLDSQVVVSLDEVPGSNRYLTRDQVGRALYNCIVIGQRIVLKPKEDGTLEKTDNKS